MTDRYLLFVIGSVILVISPGPDMAYLLARCAAQGKKAGFVAVLGFNVGAYCHLIAAMLGLSAMLAASPRAFMVVTWLGAAYLLCLGVQALRNARSSALPNADGDLAPRELRIVFRQAFLSDLLNPKVGIFFVAFLPQFVNPQSQVSVPLQIFLLGTTECLIALPINTALVFLASGVTDRFRKSSGTARYLTQAMGIVFILLGIRLLFV